MASRLNKLLFVKLLFVMSGNVPPAAQANRDGDIRSNEVQIEERKAGALKRTGSKEVKTGNEEPLWFHRWHPFSDFNMKQIKSLFKNLCAISK